MTATLQPPPAKLIDTLEELVEGLGNIPLYRIRFRPPPGTATEADVLELHDRENRLCELVDGVLVEKAMGYRESVLAGVILTLLRLFVRSRNLGLVSGADGMVRLFPGLVRIPDVAFASWERLPNRRMPTQRVPHLAPDLAVEVLRDSNTEDEMNRKRGRTSAPASASSGWWTPSPGPLRSTPPPTSLPPC
jgi:hypothetical protein